MKQLPRQIRFPAFSSNFSHIRARHSFCGDVYCPVRTKVIIEPFGVIHSTFIRYWQDQACYFALIKNLFEIRRVSRHNPRSLRNRWGSSFSLSGGWNRIGAS